jgi:hypothetical protein
MLLSVEFSEYTVYEHQRDHRQRRRWIDEATAGPADGDAPPRCSPARTPESFLAGVVAEVVARVVGDRLAVRGRAAPAAGRLAAGPPP